MDTAKYRALFVNESREYIQSMLDATLRLSKECTPEVFDHLFRLAHSIKGMAASMEYNILKVVSHRLEDLFDRLKQTNSPPDDALLKLVLMGLDIMRVMVGEIDRTGAEQSTGAEFLNALDRLEKKAEEDRKPDLELIVPARAADPLPETGENKLFFKVEIKIAEDATLASARAMVAIKRLEELGKISRLTPSPEEIRGGNFQKQLGCYMVTALSAAEIQEQLSELPDIARVVVAPVDPHTKEEDTAAQAARLPAPAETLRETLRSSAVRVETRQLDRLVEGIGELLILNAHLQEGFPENSDISRLQLLTQQLYDDALGLRMFPFKTLSSHFPRIVFDLGQRLQKKVQLRLEGDDIQMDKSILDELADPLIHLLRNAIDHGIESPALRGKIGKDETGTVKLTVARQGDRVLIRLEDDGKGLDPTMIRKAAVRKGILNERAASFLNQQEVFLLLTRSGFSTAEKVTDISGRGVGLDVVREKIEALGGAFKISSVPGQFTRFELMVPYTAAIIPALLFRSGDRMLAAPLARVERFFVVRKKDMHSTQGRPVVFYDNSTIYIEQVDAVLSGTPAREFGETFPVFVAEHQSRRVAWAVDELVSQKQILLKPFQDPLDLLRCYNGATVLGKGEVVPILDLEQLYRERYS